MAQLKYEEVPSQKAKSRFGNLVLGTGKYEMPYITPALRTQRDCKAIIKNMENGLIPQVISPYCSCKSSVMSYIKTLFGSSYDQSTIHGTVIPNILNIPDPEYEALSITCIARRNYERRGGLKKNYEDLFNTGLTSSKDGKRIRVEKAWRNVTQNYGHTGITEWSTSILEGVDSDVFLAPTPITRPNRNSVERSFRHGYATLTEAQAENKFRLYGIHFILHWKLFASNEQSTEARNKLLSKLNTWSTTDRERYSGIIFSFKIYETNKQLSDRNTGSQRRQILSDFIQDVSERVRRADGMVVAHNFGPWVLGVIDSGADIATFRASGPPTIDVPFPSGSKRSIGPKGHPNFFSCDALTEWGIEKARQRWTEKKVLPVPHCLETKPYWKWDNRKKEALYCTQARCGTLMELGIQYRNVGVNVDSPPTTINDAVKNRVNNSDITQELKDLCPSVSNRFF